jgi:hypothetical protein
MNHKYPPFWLNDFSILFDTQSMTEFLPRNHYDLNRKLNALLRFSIYYACIVSLINQNKQIFFVPIITMIVTIFFYKTQTKDHIQATIDEEDTILDYKEERTHLSTKKDTPQKLPEANPSESCVIPTKDNPFMNLNVYDINTSTKKACPSYNNRKIQKKIDTIFESGMYLDTTDLFKHNNSQNRFYTMPNTQPAADVDTFKKWLYLTPPTCKQNNPYACLDSLGRGGNKSAGTGT